MPSELSSTEQCWGWWRICAAAAEADALGEGGREGEGAAVVLSRHYKWSTITFIHQRVVCSTADGVGHEAAHAWESAAAVRMAVSDSWPASGRPGLAVLE